MSPAAGPRPSSPSPWWQPAARVLLPAAAFAAFLACYWRLYNPAAAIPAYGDVLENLWAIDWFLNGLREGGPLLFVPHVFMPEGWSLATFANGLGVFLAATPLAGLTSAAVAFNALQLTSFVVAYFGAYRMGRLVAGRGAAVLIALLFLLWGGRWVRLGGHLNLLLGSALLPWLVIAIEQAVAASGRRRWAWSAVAGVVWAATISFSLYFLWIGFFLVAAWLLGAAVGRRVRPAGALLHLVVAGGVALLLCAPYLYVYWSRQESVTGYDIRHVNEWGMSLDGLAALYPDHPLPALRALAARQTGGERTEAAFSGFGLVPVALALFGLATYGRPTRNRPPQWAAILSAAGIGLILALGTTIRWNGAPVSAPALRPLNEALWDAGHALKPTVFPGPDAPPEFADALPAPGLIPAILAPFYEGARVTARFLLVAAPGVLLLAALGFDRLPRRWLKLLVAALLLIEAARAPLTGAPFPPPSHPAFAAAAGLSLAPGQSLLDLASPTPRLLAPAIGGEALWASTLHGQPIAAGGGSVLPAHTAYLRDWFLTRPNPAGAAELPWLLRGYGIRYVLLHMSPEPGDAAAQLAAGTADLLPLGCHDGPPAPPWNYPICLLEVAPPALPSVSVHLADGWSGVEPWGVWAVGGESAVGWAATAARETRFAVEAFPFCVDGAPPEQSVEFVVADPTGADQVVASHRWETCDVALLEVVVPAEQVDIGWNRMALRFARADRPADVTGGANPDTRELSAGFTRFERLP